MMENPFKNAQVVSVSPNEEAPDLVYIDDDEDEPRSTAITTIQIELREDGYPKRSSTPYNSDSDNPIDIKIEPIETEELIRKKSSSEEMHNTEVSSYRTCIVGNDELLNFKSDLNGDEECQIQEQEQFEIIGQPNDKDLSASSDDSTRVNKSNESNDHSYSQPPPKETNSLCDDIIKSLLQETSLHNNQNAITLLKKFTNFFEDFTLGDDRNTQFSLYIKQMMSSLENKEKKFSLKDDNENPSDSTLDNSNIPDDNSRVNSPKPIATNNDEISLMDVDNEQESSNVENMELSGISIKSDVVQIKQETIETNTGIMEDYSEDKTKTNGMVDEGAEKLKVYVKKAHEKTVEFSENNQKLIDSVFVTEEDVENGNSKFKTSLFNFISFNVSLLMDIENKSDMSTIDEEISKLKKNISSRKKSIEGVGSSSRKSSTDEREKSRKMSTSSVDKESSDNDSDSSITRLTNLKTLDQKSKKYEKSQESQEKPPSKEVKKSQKERKKSMDDLNNSADSDMTSDSEIEETPSKNDKKDDDESSSDEEIKLKQKLEMKARHNLLVSSDDEEESYVTSETSNFSSDDERNDIVKIKKRKPAKKLESSEELDASEKLEDKPEQQHINADVNGNNEVDTIAENLTSIDDEMPLNVVNGEEKKAMKRARQSSFEREIFNKALLDSDESDIEDNGEQISKKLKKDSQNNNDYKKVEGKSSVVDLTQLDNRSDRKALTLEKYLDKITSNTVEGLRNFEEPTTSIKANDLSPRKSDQKSKAPSPSFIDDIDCISISSESDSEISSTISEGPSRRRKQLTEEELKEETKKAKKDEIERVKKLEAKEQRMSQYMSQRLSQSDIIAADELVLDCSEEKDLAIVVHQKLVGKLKDHQVDGIKFMYNNCYGSVDEVKENNGSGCILAHCMGLGKTLQLIVLLHTVIRYPELFTKRVLIICPKSTIHNWAEEFRKWLYCVDNRPLVYYLEDNLKIEKRIDKLREWFESKKPSVFLINYESFRILANWSGSNKRTKISLPEETIKKYKQQISKYLLDPGPNLVVCDEGHIIKNQKGATNRAITKITTKRRIILTGTPVQNALHEYYAMVEWIKPNILGTIHEFNNIYANPIKDGQNKDSTDYQIKKMKQKSYVLNKNLSRFVQRKDAQVLKEFLPRKYEYCISVPLTKIQEQLYNACLQANRSGEMGRNLLPIYTALRKIWTHPMVLQYAYERALKGENKFGSTNQQKNNKKSQNAFNEDEGDEPDDIFDTSQGTTAVTNNWWNSMLTENDLYALTSSHKMLLLFEILRLCELKKEKILIFSSFVAVLDIIERFMKAIQNQDNNPNAKLYGLDKYKTNWELGKDYFRLDGSTPRNVRQEMINAFNNSQTTRLRCFLISSKAGGQGINLVAANRCIIVDTSWNPANDNQNIFRIFRLGQKKTCYVYRLVACSTMEERVYSRSVTKEAMSHRVVEKKQIDRHYVRTELEELFVPYELKQPEKTPNFPDDDILRYLLHAHPKSAYNYHEHDSLLENKPDQELNEDEKNEAWNVYLAELRGENRYQLQQNNMNINNSNNLTMFGKTPMSSDFMKLYQDMMAPSANYSNLQGMIPSTSLTGLDSLGLSSPYFPMSSNYYAHDLMKRFGNFDPLSIYSSSSLPTPPAIHSTSTTSPLMQSVLRNTHNPISALGNMTVGAASTSSYNANNIPPAPSSIFAPPVSTNSNNQSMLPYTATTSTTVAQKNLPKKRVKNIELGYQMSKELNKIGNLKNSILNKSSARRSNEPVFTTPNSSENLSILPDNDSPAMPSNTLQHSKSLVGTSARTLQVPKRADRVSVSNPSLSKKSSNVLDNSNNARSLIRPNVIMTKTVDLKSQTSPKPSMMIHKPQSSVIQKPQMAQKSQNPTAFRLQNQAIQKLQNSTSLKSVSVTAPSTSLNSKLTQSLEARKMIDPSNQSKSSPLNKKQNLMAVSPTIKAMNRQLDKSPAVSKAPSTVQQKQGTHLINLGNTSNDSVSIIRIPPKNVVQAQQQNKSQSITVSPVPQAKVNISKATPMKQVPSNVAKIIQQNKRVIDNQTNQTLKRIRINDSMSLTQSQNSQQTGAQRANTQQISTQRVLTNQINSQRSANSQVGSQRNVNQVAGIQQGLQNVSRAPKPSQQTNKIAPTHTEVVELD